MVKRFEEAISIIESIRETSERVQISRHQCRRLADRLKNIGPSITKWKEPNVPNGIDRSLINVSPDHDKQAFASLLSVLRKSERLVTECKSVDWLSDVLGRQVRQEDFEEIHKDLSLCTTSLFLAEEPQLWRLDILASDAQLDKTEFLKDLSKTSTSVHSMAVKLNSWKSTVTEMFDINHVRDCEIECMSADWPSNVLLRPGRDEEIHKDLSLSKKAPLAGKPELSILDILASDSKLDEKELLKTLSTTYTSLAENLDSLTMTVTEMFDINHRDCEILVDENDTTHLPSYLLIAPSAFRDEEYQGDGDYGVVTKAVWLLSTVVIKDFPWCGGYLDEWINEATRMIRYRHPRVMQLMGFVPESKKVVTEYMLGGDLRKFIDKRLEKSGGYSDNSWQNGPFSLSEAMDIMRQIASALSYVHQSGYMHGDRVLTLNVMVKESRNHSLDVKIGDFGVPQERQVEWRVDLDQPCPENIRKELIRWTAPEVYSQVDGKAIMHYSAMSDIYSFGILCSEILTGKFPFEEIADIAEVRARVLAGERPLLPGTVEPDLERLIKDCWRGDCTLRPTASQICERLERIMFPEPIATLIIADQSSQPPTSGGDQKYKGDGQTAQLKVLEGKLSLPYYLRIPESDLKLIEELGKGSFACVYRAEWQGSKCAVKKLFAAQANISELQNEVDILMKLRHPRIVELMGFSESSCSIVMELMTEDLPALYKRRLSTASHQGSPFDYATTLSIIKQIASGMAYLHGCNILHRDLKGGNVLVQDHGDHIVAKIADFGVSKYTHGQSACDYTGSGFWRPPQLLRAIKEKAPFEYTNKGDIYSFAMTCYEVLTGNSPFEGYSRREVTEMLVNPTGNWQVPRRPTLPEVDSVNMELLHLIEDCWNEVPEVRPEFQVITDRLQRMHHQ